MAASERWDAIDVLRGLSVFGMLLVLNPGQWGKNYGWMDHAKWEGGNLIDMVAPAFLFCMGAVIPFALARRRASGASDARIFIYVLWRALALIGIGLLLEAYPEFDWSTVRIPGVLQRIGVSYALASGFLLFTAKRTTTELKIAPAVAAGGAAFVLLSYWALLYFVPVPGFGAPRFDPVGSWPAYIDRSVFTVPHLFQVWPVDGRVVFDPDGLLTIYSTTALVLIGAVTGLLWKTLERPRLTALLGGAALMIAALLLQPICPIIKNIYSSTFVMFGAGFALCLLALFSVAVAPRGAGKVFLPLRVLGANALLAYSLCFLLWPLLDWQWITAPEGPIGLRWAVHKNVAPLLGEQPASILFATAYIAVVILPILWLCYRKRWFLKV